MAMAPTQQHTSVIGQATTTQQQQHNKCDRPDKACPARQVEINGANVCIRASSQGALHFRFVRVWGKDDIIVARLSLIVWSEAKSGRGLQKTHTCDAPAHAREQADIPKKRVRLPRVLQAVLTRLLTKKLVLLGNRQVEEDVRRRTLCSSSCLVCFALLPGLEARLHPHPRSVEPAPAEVQYA